MSILAWYKLLSCHVKLASSALLHADQTNHLTTTIGPLLYIHVYIYMQGLESQNRSVEGDEVALRILPPCGWWVFKREQLKAAQRAAIKGPSRDAQGVDLADTDNAAISEVATPAGTLLSIWIRRVSAQHSGWLMLCCEDMHAVLLLLGKPNMSVHVVSPVAVQDETSGGYESMPHCIGCASTSCC